MVNGGGTDSQQKVEKDQFSSPPDLWAVGLTWPPLPSKHTFKIWITCSVPKDAASIVRGCEYLQWKGSSLRVFALFCTALGTLPSTDGLFINIIEGWWHRGLFNTSAWGGDRPRATDTLWMCFPSQIIWTKTISATQIHLQLQIRHIQNDQVPKECPFQGWNCIILGKIFWSPCFCDTVRAKIKDTISLPSGNNDYLGIMKFGLNNSSVSRVQVPTIPSNPNSGIPQFRQGHHLLCLSYSVVILLGSGTLGHISMILFIFF